MLNRLHLVIKAIPEESDSWTNNDVVKRWLSLFKGPLLARKFIEDETLSKAELEET